MPELPEVETTRRHLAEAAEGQVILEVEVGRDRATRRNVRPQDVTERLQGRQVLSVGRIGKFIDARVEGDLRWVIHLGMSGRIRIVEPAVPRDPHTHLVATLGSGQQVRFVDPRTFGFVAVWTDDEWEASTLQLLGRDALDDLPTAQEMATAMAGRRVPIKVLLLDQRFLAGLGNIYADEVLIRAGVHPSRPAGGLTLEEVAAIRDAIHPVLLAGIEHGGTSLDDLAYLLPDGRAGTYLDRVWVYGRTGRPCPRCGTPIEARTIGQRTSHFCPRCQR